MELLADHQARVKIIGEKAPWPGDKELCTAYNVTPADILNNILLKITESNIPQKIFESMLKNKDECIEVNLKDHYRIKAFVKFIQESPTSKVNLMQVSYFQIYNMKKEMELTIPFPALKLLEHDDLGDELGLHIDPTIACKVLEIGNTDLEISNPLHAVAQFRKAFFIEQISNV